MSGEELKKYIKRSGLTMSDVARELGTTPQNVQARLGRKTIKIDFILKIKEIIDRCAPPLPAEMEAAVTGTLLAVFGTLSTLYIIITCTH